VTRIGIVAGEASGDLLGSGLIREIRKRLPGVSFEGIGGPQMQSAGCRSLFPMDRLSVIGFEGVEKYPEILGIRNKLADHFLSSPPDLFIGVDVPDFNLGLEEKLKAAGIPTVHYVSPTVWAWRGYRIRKIRRAVDHMLTLFPFEASYYRKHHVPVTFVGHPMADQIADRSGMAAMRRTLHLPAKGTVIALLPGSRRSELKRHADLFVKTALWLHKRHANIHFVAPFINPETRAIFEEALYRQGAWFLPVTIVANQSRDAMTAADIVLLASGTATLEAALLKKPMVVTYKMSWLSYLLVLPFLHVKLYALPNILAGRKIVPELMQRDATPEKLGMAVEDFLTHRDKARSLRTVLADMHRSLRRNADARAAEAVIRLLKPRMQSEKTLGKYSKEKTPSPLTGEGRDGGGRRRGFSSLHPHPNPPPSRGRG
jgi:lipid-A-disaccharide synthase